MNSVEIKCGCPNTYPKINRNFSNHHFNNKKNNNADGITKVIMKISFPVRMIVVWLGNIYNSLIATKGETHESQLRIKQLVYSCKTVMCSVIFIYVLQ